MVGLHDPLFIILKVAYGCIYLGLSDFHAEANEENNSPRKEQVFAVGIFAVNSDGFLESVLVFAKAGVNNL
jgi:hypothetical protein